MGQSRLAFLVLDVGVVTRGKQGHGRVEISKVIGCGIQKRGVAEGIHRVYVRICGHQRLQFGGDWQPPPSGEPSCRLSPSHARSLRLGAMPG